MVTGAGEKIMAQGVGGQGGGTENGWREWGPGGGAKEAGRKRVAEWVQETL